MRMQALIAQLASGDFVPVALPDVDVARQLELHRAARVAGGYMDIDGKKTPVVQLLKMSVESAVRFPRHGLTDKEKAAVVVAQKRQDDFEARQKAALAPKVAPAAPAAPVPPAAKT